MVGHLAWHEQLYWIERAQGKILAQNVLQCGSGQPASNPPFDDMWEAWHKITETSEAYLDTLTSEKFLDYFIVDGEAHYESIGTMMRRITYHYWFHLGESYAVRQMLGHTNLPGFVGNINSAAYRAEN
jgi:DinB family protein